MRIKVWIIMTIMCASLLSITSALQITENSRNINITKNQYTQFSIQVKNTANYSLYNIVLVSNYMNMTPIDTLGVNETKTASVRIYGTDFGTFTENAKLVGFTKVNCSQLSQSEVAVNLKSFDYTTIPMCQNDKLRFLNNFDFPVTMNIYKISGTQVETADIAKNATYLSSVFTEVGQYYAVDNYHTLFFKNINVSSEASLAHVASEDTNLNLLLRVIPQNTNLSSTFYDTNFTVRFDSSQSSFFVLRNAGSETAFNIHLSGEWFTYEANNFNLASGESKAVNYKIQPYIGATVDTNKNYVKNILVDSDNANSYAFNISIFVPYSEINTGNESLPDFWIQKKRFCDAYPSSPLCLTEPYIIYRNQTIYAGPPVTLNMSAETFQELVSDFLRQKDERATLNNYIKQVNDEAVVRDIATSVNISEVKTSTDQVETHISGLKSALIVIFAASLTMIVVGVIIYFGVAAYKNKQTGGMPEFN